MFTVDKSPNRWSDLNVHDVKNPLRTRLSRLVTIRYPNNSQQLPATISNYPTFIFGARRQQLHDFARLASHHRQCSVPNLAPILSNLGTMIPSAWNTRNNPPSHSYFVPLAPKPWPWLGLATVISLYICPKWNHRTVSWGIPFPPACLTTSAASKIYPNPHLG